MPTLKKLLDEIHSRSLWQVLGVSWPADGRCPPTPHSFSRGVPCRSWRSFLPPSGGADPILHEGIVDLLRGKLAVIDDLQIVDPGTVIKAAGMGSQGEVMDVGLAARVLDASGRTEEAAEARATYRELWADADRGISLPGG